MTLNLRLIDAMLEDSPSPSHDQENQEMSTKSASPDSSENNSDQSGKKGPKNKGPKERRDKGNNRPKNQKDNQEKKSAGGKPKNEDEGQKDSRFKQGQIIKLVRVRFPGNAKSFPFLVGKRNFSYGQKVMAMSDRGMTVGYINSFPYEIPFDKSMLPIRSISNIATAEDLEKQKENIDKEKKAAALFQELISKHELDMVLTHVEYIQFGKKSVFYFNAPARVDFRELVKDLVKELKIRIELRQISVRDRTAAIGAIGVCGLQTCCNSFLKNYGNSSIKMAKNQNLALIPSKINGICGQIKCCMKYEDQVYSEKRGRLPKEGQFIQTQNGDRGKVLRLHVLVEQFEMLTDRGEKRSYAVDQFLSDAKIPEGWSFPRSFDHITDETKTVIGLKAEELQKAKDFQEGLLEKGSIDPADLDPERLEESETDGLDETNPAEKLEKDSEESNPDDPEDTRNSRGSRSPREGDDSPGQQQGQRGKRNNRSGRHANRGSYRGKGRGPSEDQQGSKEPSKDQGSQNQGQSGGPNRGNRNQKNNRRKHNYKGQKNNSKGQVNSGQKGPKHNRT